MNHHTFLGTIPSYFARRARYQVRELYLSRAILDLATATVMLFEPIYLYKLGFSLAQIMYFFLAIYLLYFIFLPLGAKFAKRFGFEHSIFLSSPMQIAYYASLFLMTYSLYFVIPAVIFYTLQKTFYWPGYHANFAHYGLAEEQGREVSNITVIISLVYIAGPFLGGALINWFGFPVLFIVASVLILVSNLPLMLTPEKFEPSDFSYKDSLKRLFRKEHRRKFFSYLGFGEELIVLVLWPIFIYTIVKSEFSVGYIIAGATLFTSIIVLYVGKLIDKKGKHGVLRFSSIIYSLSWFLRILTSGAFGIFLVDTLSRTGKNMVSVALTTITYNRARNGGIMKQIIFFESALVLGKILAMLLVLGILVLFSVNPWIGIFILAGLFSLLYGLL